MNYDIIFFFFFSKFDDVILLARDHVIVNIQNNFNWLTDFQIPNAFIFVSAK